jgi:hypothetical protein
MTLELQLINTVKGTLGILGAESSNIEKES